MLTDKQVKQLNPQCFLTLCNVSFFDLLNHSCFLQTEVLGVVGMQPRVCNVPMTGSANHNGSNQSWHCTVVSRCLWLFGNCFHLLHRGESIYA